MAPACLEVTTRVARGGILNGVRTARVCHNSFYAHKSFVCIEIPFFPYGNFSTQRRAVTTVGFTRFSRQSSRRGLFVFLCTLRSVWLVLVSFCFVVSRRAYTVGMKSRRPSRFYFPSFERRERSHGRERDDIDATVVSIGVRAEDRDVLNCTQKNFKIHTRPRVDRLWINLRLTPCVLVFYALRLNCCAFTEYRRWYPSTV